jgi:hypothetical protein
MSKIRFDFTGNEVAQDMLVLVQKKKNLTLSEAIDYALSPDNYRKVIKEKWSQIAIEMWDHGDPERVWNTLENPIVEMELDENKIKALKDVEQVEKVNLEMALTCFLVFTVEMLGYHV